ncbi:RNA ligase/cyclic nucleotide phosphodiesterase [Trichoderma chlorosporum]
MHLQLRYIVAVCICGISLLLFHRSYPAIFATMTPKSKSNTDGIDKNTQESIHAEPAKWTGEKFDDKGNVLPFPGNTILCHLPQDSELYKTLLPIYETLEKSKFTKFYTLLPPPSWHMTVFEGVCDQRRERATWPQELALDAPLQSCHDLFRDKLSTFDLGIQPPLRLSVTRLLMSKAGIRLDLAAVDAAEEKRLRGLRDRLSVLLQIRAPGHETYVFHLALAYRIIPVSKEDGRALTALLHKGYETIPHEFELGAPEFCHFDDMFAFHRQFYLKEQS